MAWELEAFVRSLSALSPNTVDAYRRDVRDFVVWAERAQLDGPARVDHLVLRRYLSFLTTRRMAKRSIARKAAALRRYFAWLTRTGALASNPARRLTAAAGGGRLPHVLKAEELRTLLDDGADDGPIGRRDRAQCLLMSGCGLGGAEVLQLQLSDIDWSGRRLRVVRPKTNVTIWLPLLPEIARSLADYIRHARPSPTTSRYVFLSCRMPFQCFKSSGVLRHRVRYLARRAGIEAPILGTHLFRHSHATRHVVLGTDIKTLSDILGHQDPETTSIYTRAAVQRLRRLALPMPL